MDFDDVPDEEGPVFAWLPPEDRLWRHPSEVGTPARPAPPARSGGRTWTVALVAGLVGALLASGVGLASGSFSERTVVEPVATPQSPSTVAVDLSSAGATTPAVSASWQSIADAVAPALVAITVYGSAGRQVVSGVVVGSGRQRSYVMTAADALSGATSLQISFDNGTAAAGHVVGTDPVSGIGVVWVGASARMLPTYGSVSQVRDSDLVLAVGARSAGSPSVSAPAALTSLDSQVTSMGGQYSSMMAFSGATVPDAAAGGALVDAAGAVVGINTDVTSVDPAQQNLSWAVPIDTALRDADALIAGHRPVDTSIGVAGANDLSTVTAHQLGLLGGAQIGAVSPGSPAARAGLATGDIVTSFDGNPVLSSGALVSDLARATPGKRARIGYLAGGHPHAATVVVAAAS